jgi:alkanesulfonate monooxygenase SsuD/methylene tetrahydromethanopterin reductase-like flavin-dependent oxidoreductase (luciferase family)
MLGPAKIRIGVMPGPWPEGPVAAERFWRLAMLAPTLEPLTALAAAARRTRRLKFGTAVLVLPFRIPLLTAKGLATLDLLSGGRVFPAVGVGVSRTRRSSCFAGSGETTR